MLRARYALSILALAIPLLTACGDDGAPAEEEGFTDSALVKTAASGATLTTTARVNFREGPSKQDDVIRVLPVGATVTALGGGTSNGYLKVEQAGEEGWVYATYLSSNAPKAAANEAEDNGADDNAAGVGTGQIESCKASFYDEGQKTANGETFNPNALTAAHKTLKFNTKVRVTNKSNGKTVIVRINDRGPFVSGRCIDLSRAAFATIASTSQGVASVSVEVLK